MELSHPFDSKYELERVKSVPKTSRRSALENFKEKLVAQESGWARCFAEIEKNLSQNPDSSLSEIFPTILKYNKNYHFSPEQIIQAKAVIRFYQEKRLTAKNLMADFPNPRLLIEKITGYIPSKDSQIEVELKGMSLEFLVDNHTYETIYPFVYLKANLKNVRNSLGFAQESQTSPYVYATFMRTSHSNQNTKTHEYQHHQNALLRSLGRQWYNPFADKLFTIYQKETNPEQKSFLFDKLLEIHFRNSIFRASDEILAWESKHPLTLSETKNLFLNFSGNSYDYTHDFRQKFNSKSNSSEFQLVQKILVDRYSHAIINAVKAFQDLEEKAGYSFPEIIGLLSDQPLTSWPSIARRHLKAKK